MMPVGVWASKVRSRDVAFDPVHVRVTLRVIYHYLEFGSQWAD